MMSVSGCGGGGGPCGACKYLRRKCVANCTFAPYFSFDQGLTQFAAVHKVFGASNLSKLLATIPMHRRQEAVMTLSYQAQARLHDPIYGCVSHITTLQQQVTSLQGEIARTRARLAMQQPQPHHYPAASTYDFSSLILPTDLQNPAQLQSPMGPNQFSFNLPGPGPGPGLASTSAAAPPTSTAADALQALAPE